MHCNMNLLIDVLEPFNTHEAMTTFPTPQEWSQLVDYYISSKTLMMKETNGQNIS